MKCMLWLVKRHGSFLDPTTVSNCTKCAKFFCPTMLLFLSSWAKLMSRRHSLLIIFRGWWWWYGSEFSQSSFNSIVLSVSVVKQCCFKSCYCFCFYSASYTLFWFQKVFCLNEVVALVTLIFLIDLDYMQIYPLFILKEKAVYLITFSSHKHPLHFTKNAEVSWYCISSKCHIYVW